MQMLPDLQLSIEREQEFKLVEAYIKDKARAGTTLQILDAGCGRRQWPINLDGVPYVLTGVDLDKNALEMRKNTKKDLHEIIQGDLRNVPLAPNKYDVIYNAFVLEHIDHAEGVLQNFLKWLKPGGIIVIRIPDPHSVRGFFTRITPFWVHVFYYKYVVRRPNAGTPGYGPYETYYHPVVSRQGIHAFCQSRHMAVREERGDGYHAHGQGVTRVLINLILKCVDLLSFGRLSAKHTNLLYILEKPLASAS